MQLEVGPFLVRVRSDVPAFASHLEQLYFDFPRRPGIHGHFDVQVVASGGVRRWWRRQATVVANGHRPFFPLPARLAGPAMEWGLNWCIGRVAHRFVVIHAAVVELGGRALILPGAPGAGKSTLCAALAFLGWRLLSDEFALIDPASATVIPVPRPISLKDASIEIIRDRYPDIVCGPEARDVEEARFVHVRPPSDSVRRSDEPALPGWIVFPRYVPGAQTSLVALPKARALVRAADQSFNYNYLGTKGFHTLVELVRQSGCYTLEYSALDEVLALLTRVARN